VLSGATPRLTDQVIYYEPGLNPVFAFTNPGAALVKATGIDDPAGIVSLGGWTDDPGTGSGNPTGLVLGWSQPVLNGPGVDLRVVGNAFDGFYEPGTIEVALESDGGGATTEGWQDETFYLVRPDNLGSLPTDPRTGTNPVMFDAFASSPYSEAWWQLPLSGYADVHPGGDLIDLDDAIDSNGNPVDLESIAYIRVRSVSDSSLGAFGFFSTEIDYIEALQNAPPPQKITSIATGYRKSPLFTTTPGQIIEALDIDDSGNVFYLESDYAAFQAPTRLYRRSAGDSYTAASPLYEYGTSVFGSLVKIVGGTLYFGESSDGTIRQIPVGGGSAPLLATVPQNFDLAAATGRAFLSHNPNPLGGEPANKVSLFDLDSGFLQTIIDTSEFSGALTLARNGDLWYASPTPGQGVFRFSRTEIDTVVQDQNLPRLSLAPTNRVSTATAARLAIDASGNILSHDFFRLSTTDPETLTETEIASSERFFGTMADKGYGIYIIVTNFSMPQSTVHRLLRQTTVTDWRSDHFSEAELADPGQEATLWGDLADPDADGLANAIEYAFAMDPRLPGDPAVTGVNVSGDMVSFSFPRFPGHTSASYSAQVSSDLTTWETVAESRGGGAAQSLNQAFGVEESVAGAQTTVTLRTVTGSGRSRFFRVAVSLR